jgi:hypothetical protein
MNSGPLKFSSATYGQHFSIVVTLCCKLLGSNTLPTHLIICQLMCIFGYVIDSHYFELFTILRNLTYPVFLRTCFVGPWRKLSSSQNIHFLNIQCQSCWREE